MKTKLFILLTFVSFINCAQKSPGETAKGTVASTSVEIAYSSPRVGGRTIYGELVPYSKVWRAGANENTTISFSNAVKVNGKELPAGKYGFFIIPNKNGKWIAIFNKKNDSWGSNSYSEAEDALRLEVKAKGTKENKEELTYKITDEGIKFVWADQYFKLKLSK